MLSPLSLLDCGAFPREPRIFYGKPPYSPEKWERYKNSHGNTNFNSFSSKWHLYFCKYRETKLLFLSSRVEPWHPSCFNLAQPQRPQGSGLGRRDLGSKGCERTL